MKQEILFTKEECYKIISYKNEFDISDLSQKNRIDKGVGLTNKKYDFYWIEKNNTTNWVFDRLFNWFYEQTNTKVLMNTIVKGFLHNYKAGDVFPKHIDRVGIYKNRIYNVGIQLSDGGDYDGGDYVIYNYDLTKEHISKKIGNCYYYDAGQSHEVTQITNGERWSFLHHINEEHILNNNKLNNII